MYLQIPLLVIFVFAMFYNTAPGMFSLPKMVVSRASAAMDRAMDLVMDGRDMVMDGRVR
jgi:hypothetical protein